jgi:surface antigen
MADCPSHHLMQARVPAALRRMLAAAGLGAAVLAAGCASKSAGLPAAETDRSLYTSNIQTDPKRDAPERVSDENTIRNAVSAADVALAADGQPMAWANSDTGSRGAITALDEYQDQGRLCRRFTTSRESFDGVALFQGEACKAQSGDWRMRDFKPL